MDVTVRQGERSGSWGMVEQYKVWKYKGKGYIEVIVGVDINTGKFTVPYVYKGRDFVSAEVIAKDIGIDRYVAAKKPFFTLIENSVMVNIRVKVDYGERIIDIEDSIFDVYSLGVVVSETQVMLRKCTIPDIINDSKEELIRLVGESFGNKAQFLESRILN